jgi:uncharacterized protein (TIGR03435 family)
MLCLAMLIVSLLNVSRSSNRIRNDRLARALLSAIVLLPFPILLAAQEPPQIASPIATGFRWATIKPSDPRAQGHQFRVIGHRLETTNTSLFDLISFAYRLHATQIIGAPDWVRSDKFDLILQADGDVQPSAAQWTSMLQIYLVESSRLSFHSDTKDLPLYVLAISQSGVRLAASARDASHLPELSITLGARNAASANLVVVSATNATVSDLASLMERVVLEWPVVDQTGVTGRFDFVLSWTPDGAQFGDLRARLPAAVDVANAPPYLATALQQQLGLTLDLVDAPSQVLVIDYVEKPAGNTGRQLRLQDKLSERIWHPSLRPPWLTFSTDINPFLVTNDLY